MAILDFSRILTYLFVDCGYESCPDPQSQCSAAMEYLVKQERLQKDVEEESGGKNIAFPRLRILIIFVLREVNYKSS